VPLAEQAPLTVAGGEYEAALSAVTNTPPRTLVSKRVVLSAVELIAGPTDSDGGVTLAEIVRSQGQNDVGVVVWRMRLRFPAADTSGRDIIVIANDITHENGAFGPREGQVFTAASRLARKEGIPRIYLAANSGLTDAAQS
jgi:hypothetical protein